MYAVNAMVLTKPEISKTVSRSLISDYNNIELHSVVVTKACKARAQCPRSLKSVGTKKLLEVTMTEGQRFKRGFVWDDNMTDIPSSPSALNTKTAPPLPSPPQSIRKSNL